ncbi:uncharacterized protein LOC117124253 [Anneissia japonica]|uniref:uncharacterized protein LOC117124253 n=1 Tax=Anneissia japonica TaxID=1529436 RepID=UPI001425614C|nr:uncharacterized protein LOC117124253 [Anneissia japonica]
MNYVLNFDLMLVEIELEKEDVSSSSVSVRVIVTAGRVNQITTTCSEGNPSPNIDVVDSEIVVVFCNGTRPSNNVTVNVSASYLEILATASVTITTKTSPATLKEQFTNMTAGIASWSLPLDEIADDFNVSCSEGSVALLDKNGTHGAAICHDLVPGSTVIITVNSVTDSEYGMPASLNIQLDPDVVTFTNRTSSLDSISVAWEMRTGFASKFVVNCSSGVPASSVIDAVVGSASIECSCLNPLQIVNVTVIAVANSKQGLPASEIVSTGTVGLTPKTEKKNRALLGNIFQTLIEIRSRIECQSFCAQTNECKSYNYASSLKVCQLNNVTKEDTNAANFQETGDYIYATLKHDNACTSKDCCLDPTTNKSKDKYCYIQIELEKEDASSSSVSVRVIVTAGRANQINTTCSEGDPSPTPDVVDFSENVVVSCDGVRSSRNVTVSVSVAYLDTISVTNSVTIKSKTSPPTLEEQFTNKTAAVAHWFLSPDEFADNFIVNCSKGSWTVLEKNNFQGRVMCHDLEPGSTVNISVTPVYDSEPGEHASLNIHLEPDVVEFTSQTSSLVSISVEWEIRSGFASEFVVNCSSGVPVSSVVDAADGSGSMDCSGLTPGVQVEVTVVAVVNSKQSLPASEIVSTDGTVNITLVEDVATNTTTIVAKMTSNAPPTSVYKVLCSTGDPFPTQFKDAETTTVYCIGVNAGQSANLSVEAFYGNWSVGSVWISISTVPEEVVFEPINDYTIYKEMLGETPFAATTWNLRSGIADSFLITCSDGQTLEDDSFQNILRIGICSLPSNTTLESINITVEAKRGDKIGRPAAITVSVIKNDVTISTGEISEASNGSTASEVVLTAPILTSCDALKIAGFDNNGTYLIDPDGPNAGLDPFSVDCDMTSDIIKGYTTIHHNKEEDGNVNNAESPCSFKVNITYDLDLSQIYAVKNISSSCRQFIKYACIGTCFHGSSKTYHYWTSVDGEMMVNWGGVPTGTKGCACGLTSTCDKNEMWCNCNVNDSELRMDQGYLTDKTKLPVSQLCFGDTGQSSESGVYTLGPLQCA